jgi:ABC-2 type transport system permease protein
MVTFAGLSITLVIRREQSLLKRLRATPLPAPTFIAAMLASTLVVFAAETVALFTLGALVYGTPFPSEIGSMIALVVYGGICFAAMGVGLAGLIRSAEGSSAVVNLIVLPMAFLSGAFGPTLHYPHVLRVIGDLLPLTYVVRLSQGIYLLNQPIWSQPRSLLILGAWGVAGLVLAMAKFRWEPHGT